MKKFPDAITWLTELAAPLTPIEFLLNQAKELLLKSGQNNPPFDPNQALPPSIIRIDTADISRDGMLIPVNGGFIMKIKSSSPRVRQRFTCAHEIGHTYFFDLSGERPWRPYESLSNYWPEEHLCYAFAEEMLVPESHIKRIIENNKAPHIETVLKLAQTFDVSVETVARRISNLALWECVFILFRKDLNTDSVKYTPLRKHKSRKINWDTLRNEAHDPIKAFKQPPSTIKSNTRANEIFRDIKKTDEWYIESRRIGGKEIPTVISIIAPKNLADANI